MNKKDLIEEIDITVESVEWWKDRANEAIKEGDKINSEIDYLDETKGLPGVCSYCDKKIKRLKKKLKNTANRMDFLLAKGKTEAENLKRVQKKVKDFYINGH